MNTWIKYGAVTVIPPQIAKNVPNEFIIDSRAIWTKRSDIKNLDDTKQDYDIKCRIVGKGFQERYDDKVRRDSPTSSPFMHNVLCSVSASEKLVLIVGNAKGAFLQGKKITRQLYFRLPKNTGNFALTGIATGSLLRCEKSIYGKNDVARQWCLALEEILESFG